MIARKRLPVAPAYPLHGHMVHIGQSGDVWNVSPGGAEDCMQRCWEVQSPDFGTGSVRGRLCQCVDFGSCVHLHGYLIQ